MRSRKYEKKAKHILLQNYTLKQLNSCPQKKNNETPSDNQFENNTYQPDDLEIIHI